jgi:hypothetical protein
MRHCPRCVARHHTVVELLSSEMPTSILYANGSLPTADTPTAPRKHVPAGRRAQGESGPMVAMAALTDPSRLARQPESA